MEGGLSWGVGVRLGGIEGGEGGGGRDTNSEISMRHQLTYSVQDTCPPRLIVPCSKRESSVLYKQRERQRMLLLFPQPSHRQQLSKPSNTGRCINSP